jgi:hypothetical protein
MLDYQESEEATRQGVRARAHPFTEHGMHGRPAKSNVPWFDVHEDVFYDTPQHGLVNFVKGAFQVMLEGKGPTSR